MWLSEMHSRVRRKPSDLLPGTQTIRLLLILGVCGAALAVSLTGSLSCCLSLAVSLSRAGCLTHWLTHYLQGALSLTVIET